MNQNETYSPAPAHTWGPDNLTASPNFPPDNGNGFSGNAFSGNPMTAPMGTPQTKQSSAKQPLVIIGAVVLVVVVVLGVIAIVGAMLYSDDQTVASDGSGLAEAPSLSESPSTSAADDPSASSRLPDWQQMPADMVAQVPKQLGDAVVYCSSRHLIMFDIEDEVPSCSVSSAEIDTFGMQSFYYLDNKTEVEAAIVGSDYLESEVYRSKEEKDKVFAVHTDSIGGAYLVHSPAPDKAIVYRFLSATEDDIVSFLETFNIVQEVTTEAV